MSGTVLIVDDEAPARSKVIHFLSKCDPGATAEEAPDGPSAVDAIESRRYDAVFLDIQMPGMSGFEVVYNVGLDHMPPYVFATAFDAYAIQAFEAHAIDYLLKPFTFDRFQQSYLRLRRLATPGWEAGSAGMKALMGQMQAKAAMPWRIAVRQDGRTHMVDPEHIVFVESDEHYLRYHLADRQLYERGSLKELLAKLDTAGFRQVHKSIILNLRFLKEIEPLAHGDQSALLSTGKRITISRRYSRNLNDL
ncbi:MAG: response regulator transcription factor [Opitutales bacterium]|nr:response regulator transcription factor [Opitutales bacterium]